MAVEKQRTVNGKAKHKMPGGFRDHPENICRDGAAKSKGRQFQIELRRWLEAAREDGTCLNDEFRDYLSQIAAAGTKQSIDAIEMLWNRAYGKPAQAIDANVQVNAASTLAALIAAGNAEREAK